MRTLDRLAILASTAALLAPLAVRAAGGADVPGVPADVPGEVFTPPGCGGVIEIPTDLLSAGVVTITGGRKTLTANPGDTGWYSVVPDPPDDLFAPGADLEVKAAGGAVAAFEAHVKGVADMEPGWSGELTMKYGEVLRVPWVVRDDGATVEVVLQIGWHGIPATDIIWCETDEAAGGVDIPASFVEMTPPWGGEGLFQNPSWARRMTRAVVDTAAGPIEVRASSRVGLYYVH